MDFQTSVKTCLKQKYAGFSGRASRSEYWWFVLAYVIGAVILSLPGIWVLSILYALALLSPAAAAGFRRLQDTGRPGWYIAIPTALSLLNTLTAPDMSSMRHGVVPSGMGGFALLGLVQLVVGLVFLWWLTRPSDPGTNDYGPPSAT